MTTDEIINQLILQANSYSGENKMVVVRKNNSILVQTKDFSSATFRITSSHVGGQCISCHRPKEQNRENETRCARCAFQHGEA